MKNPGSAGLTSDRLGDARQYHAEPEQTRDSRLSKGSSPEMPRVEAVKDA